MFRSVCLALCALLLAAPAAAQSEAPRKTFLWEVKSDRNTLYLFGSPGLGNGDLYPVAFWAEAAYTRAQVLAVESDLSDEARFERDSAGMRYLPPDSLDQHISPELYGEVSDYFALQALPMAASDHLKPYALAFGLMNKAARTVGLDPAYDAPFYFIAKAKADNKPIEEIEGIAQQLHALDALPMRSQEELLRSALEQSARGQWAADLQAEVAAWKSGDLDDYTELELKSYASMPHGSELRHAVVEARHRAIADRIAEYLNSGKVYFAVLGAPHMVGPDSLLDELARRGFRIQRL